MFARTADTREVVRVDPKAQAILNRTDQNLSSGGLLLLPDLASNTTHPHLLVQADKEGTIYLIDRDNMGHISTSNCNGADPQIVQELPGAIGRLWGTPAYWNGNVYFCGDDHMKAFSFNGGRSGLLSPSPTSRTTKIFAFTAPTPSISASGTMNGIVWGLDNASWNSSCCQVFYAYDATNLNTMLHISSLAAGNRDQGGGAVKFTVPTVASGKVYVDGQKSLTVYGLLPN